MQTLHVPCGGTLITYSNMSSQRKKHGLNVLACALSMGTYLDYYAVAAFAMIRKYN